MEILNKQKIVRNSEIVRLFTEDCLMQVDIAVKFGVTRERVRQILRGYLEDYQVAELNGINRKKKQDGYWATQPKKYCKFCGKEIRNRRKFCNIDCFKNYTNVYGWRSPKNMAIRKARHKIQMHEYYVRLKANPIVWAERQKKVREYHKEYYQKNKKRIREYQSKYHKKNKSLNN